MEYHNRHYFQRIKKIIIWVRKNENENFQLCKENSYRLQTLIPKISVFSDQENSFLFCFINHFQSYKREFAGM